MTSTIQNGEGVGPKGLNHMLDMLDADVSGAPKREWYPVHRDYLAAIMAAARQSLAREPAIAEGEGERELREGDKVRFASGEIGEVIRFDYVVQLDETDGSQGTMGGSVGVWTAQRDELTLLMPNGSAALAQSSTPPASK